MSEDTVRALPRDLIDVQLHTHRHRAPRDRELFLREIRDNASVIRRLRGERSPMEHFCYPSGEYFGEFLGWLGEPVTLLGVIGAVLCVSGVLLGVVPWRELMPGRRSTSP